MSDPSQADPSEPDPGEVEPTDNSAAAEIDLDRLADVEREAAEGG